jgi:NADPH:quinone reductase-like Zn-dependent oxidoreductase
VFPESGLVACPSNLGFEEAATLPCAAATAWNALYGLESRSLKPGDWVLTQGTGGVSLFGVQFAVAAGARVIATTSSKEKAEKLKELGATHVINYKEDANWGETAKGLTPGRVGVKHILEVGGPATLAQSLKAVHIDGVISIIGFVAGMTAEKPPSFLTLLSNFCCVRGVSVGSRAQFEDMNRAIEANGIRPVVDERVFEMEYLKEAYQYMWEQRHFGKVVVKIARRKDNEKQPSGKL